ncbi:MAG: cupin domain-containing protein [Planctomycetota bacterium]
MERVNANELEYRHGDSGPKYLFRGPNIDWGLIRFQPGETLGAHYHDEVEETFYFTRGAGVFKVNGVEHDIAAGDAFRVEPGETHDVLNTGDEPLDGVFIKDRYSPDDKVSEGE